MSKGRRPPQIAGLPLLPGMGPENACRCLYCSIAQRYVAAFRLPA